MHLYIKQSRETVITPFILADNKMTGFSAFSTTEEMPVIVKPGCGYDHPLVVRVYDEQGEDVTLKYVYAYTKINGVPCSRGDKIARIILRRRDPSTSGRVYLYSWEYSAEPFKGTGDDLRNKQFDDLANKYKPQVKKIEPLLPTREAERLASLFGFFEDKNKMLRDAGFILPEEE